MPMRIDSDVQQSYQGFRFRMGRPLPFGATVVPGGINFSIISKEATAASLVLFNKGESTPLVEIPFPKEFRIGDVFTMLVFDLDVEKIEYGYRVDGPVEPHNGLRFNNKVILMDPYARAIAGRDDWGRAPDWSKPYQYRAFLVPDDYDWEDDQPPGILFEDLVIYEAHVRGFTCHPSSGVDSPGTFNGLREKLPYLKALGVNCIELMPIFEFDEFDGSRRHPESGEQLLNYWGYSTVGFFAPKAGYAVTGRLGMQMDEFKNLVKDMHSHGIEVMLDVVFNHTAEGNENGPTISFRGLDNRTYYMLGQNGEYANYSGTGNTLNCNNPLVRSMVLDSLRYWVSEFHVDGFRFDLASILGRDNWGNILSNPPLLESLAHDPVLSKCKLVAEAWDTSAYQVGQFPSYGRWAEWNGRYRDTLRRFLKGDTWTVEDLAQRLQGSPDLYGYNNRGTTASINFITCHDGFTLNDLVSYDGKHNEANGEGNRDGNNNNQSWNCGVEGETQDPDVLALRRRQMKNAIAMLMVSQGVPMILMGDEVGRTQQGNNNAYCHDSELSWLDWGLLERNEELLRFTTHCITFRRKHPVLRSPKHLSNTDRLGTGFPDISWHGTRAWQPDWSENSRSLAFMLDGGHARDGREPDNSVYVAMNMYWEALWFELPACPADTRWHVFVNTGAESPADVCEPSTEPLLPDQGGLLVGPRSVLILIAR